MNRNPAIFLLMILFSVALTSHAQEVHLLSSGTKTSLRGLSVVNDNIVWVSGSNGMVGRSANGGKTWKWMTVKGFDSTEFRDIEAFDANTAIIMAIETPAYILKTTDAGETWKVVYENKTKGMFLDAMHFVDNSHGVVIGDPIGNRVFAAETFDGGNTWKEWEHARRPALDSGEAFFAASGTNIRLFEKSRYFMVSGGKKSRFFTNGISSQLPLLQGTESTGANSIAVYDAGMLKGSDRIVVVGGDFFKDSSNEKNCFYSTNGGKTWKAPQVAPHGYRSCVEYLSKHDLVSCGLNGVDYSKDGGKNWKWISKEGFHVCRIAKIGSAIFFAGNNGKVARIVWTR